jgi:hypothetical protein
MGGITLASGVSAIDPYGSGFTQPTSFFVNGVEVFRVTNTLFSFVQHNFYGPLYSQNAAAALGDTTTRWPSAWITQLNLGASGASATLTTTATNAISTAASFRSTGATGGIGYATGAGGAVTQITSKATGVTLNTVTGNVTTHNAALAAATIVSFVFTNSAVAADDLIVCSHHSGGTIGAYTINARATGAGTAAIDIRNNTAGSLGEALVIKFAIIKSVVA